LKILNLRYYDIYDLILNGTSNFNFGFSILQKLGNFDMQFHQLSSCCLKIGPENCKMTL